MAHQHKTKIRNKNICNLTEDGVFDYRDQDINCITIQNPGNVVGELHDGWEFPPGSVVNIGTQHDLSLYDDVVRVKFTGVVVSKDPANPDPPNPKIQAWPVYAVQCNCPKCS